MDKTKFSWPMRPENLLTSQMRQMLERILLRGNPFYESSNRYIEAKLGKVLKALQTRGFVDGHRITEAGIEILKL